MDSYHHVLAAAQGEPWNFVFAAVIAVVLLGLVVLFVGALVSVLRADMSGTMKVVWVVFAFCAPFLGPVLWFLLGKKDVARGRVRV